MKTHYTICFCLLFSVIESEKEQQKMRQSIESFDPKNMKHVETQEKNSLPTKEGIFVFVENLKKGKIMKIY